MRPTEFREIGEHIRRIESMIQKDPSIRHRTAPEKTIGAFETQCLNFFAFRAKFAIFRMCGFDE